MIKKLFSLLSLSEKKYFYKIGFIMIFMSIMEVVGIASILPFIKVLSNNNFIYENEYLHAVYLAFKFTEINDFMIFLGFMSFLFLLSTNIFSILAIRKIYTFIYSLNHSLATKLLKSYLYQDYIFFVNKHSSELTKNIITEVEQTIVGIFLPLANLISKLFVTIMILLFLMFVNFKVTILVFTILGGGYFILYFFIKKKISQAGSNRSKHNNLRYKATNEAFGAIKEIKLIGKEDIFLEKFKSHSKIFANSMAYNAILGLIPKYTMEILAFGGIILSITLMLIAKVSVADALPLISLFVFAGYRLMPAMQQIFASFTKMKFSRNALNV